MSLDVAILAAGRGSRLGAHTDDQPKCFVRLGGVSLIERHISALHLAGLNRITIVTGYCADHFEALGFETAHNPRWAETNMVSSLLCAETVLSSDNDLVVSYGDIVIEPRVVTALLETPGDIVTVIDSGWLDLWRLRSEEPLEDAETLRMDSNGLITEIGGKPERVEDIEGQYIGLTKFTQRGKNIMQAFIAKAASDESLLSKPLDKAHFTDLLQGLIGSGHDVRAAVTRGGWLEVDTPGDLAVYERMFDEKTLARFYDPGALATGKS